MKFDRMQVTVVQESLSAVHAAVLKTLVWTHKQDQPPLTEPQLTQQQKQWHFAKDSFGETAGTESCADITSLHSKRRVLSASTAQLLLSSTDKHSFYLEQCETPLILRQTLDGKYTHNFKNVSANAAITHR